MNSRAATKLSVLLALCLTVSGSALAQSLKIGRFDFTTSASVKLIYTTNVDGAPDGPVEKEREDYFLEFELRADSAQTFNPNSTLNMGFGLRTERHFVRDDLDTLNEPFGDIRLRHDGSFGRYNTYLEVGYSRTEETRESAFVPGGRKKRDPNNIFSYGGGVDWSYQRLTLSGSYLAEQERHDDPEFQDGDEDREDVLFDARWDINQRFALIYEYTLEKTDSLQDDTDYVDWQETQFVGFEATLIEDPAFLYTFGMEKAQQEEDTGTWEPVHEFAFEKVYDFTDTVTLGIDLNYVIREEQENLTRAQQREQVSTITLDHFLDRYASQQLAWRRQPRDTFGTNSDTDTTEYSYRFDKSELLVRDLSLSAGYTYTIDRPTDAEDQRTHAYTLTLSLDRQLTRKLSRTLAYTYDYEKNNLTPPTEEHRVELGLTYVF